MGKSLEKPGWYGIEATLLARKRTDQPLDFIKTRRAELHKLGDGSGRHEFRGWCTISRLTDVIELLV